jgi:hypothetical protein
MGETGTRTGDATIFRKGPKSLQLRRKSRNAAGFRGAPPQPESPQIPFFPSYGRAFGFRLSRFRAFVLPDRSRGGSRGTKRGTNLDLRSARRRDVPPGDVADDCPKGLAAGQSRA